jgi:bifunctional ADP-heptose synthase (sugar kinase/adenylyltransferase)
MKPTLPSNLPKKGLSLLRSFSRLKLMVAGDLVADETVYGVTERISREAPVLILRYSHTVTAPGGAANAACNARDLGAQVFLLGVVGRDEGGKRLMETFRQKGLDLDGVL